MDAPRGLLIPDEDPATYYRRQLDVANHTGLTKVGKSPAHFKWWVEHPEDDEESEALAFGKAFHCAVLEPGVFDATYTVVPSDAPPRPSLRQRKAKTPAPETRRAIDWWALFDADHKGRTYIAGSDYEHVRRMAESAFRHSQAVAGLLTGGIREGTLRWTDEESGLQCKARLDNHEPGVFMLDLKKTRDASPEGFARSISHYEYDQQAAHYCAGGQAIGKPPKHFIFLACEDRPPYVCQPYFLDPMAEERGMALRRKRMRQQAECLRTGVWPGYSQKIEQISLPAWAFYNVEDVK